MLPARPLFRRRMPGPRASTCALVVAGVTGLLCAHPLPGRACVYEAPGIVDRSVWPGVGRQPPTNTRFAISYGSRWAVDDPGVPALGPDVVLLDGSGTPVPSSFERAGAQVILSPSQELLPNSLYRLADRRTVPCDARAGGCALLETPAIFASFTTAARADERAPTFAGLASMAVQPRLSGDTSCGPADYYPIDLTWVAGADDVAGRDVRYRLYRAAPGSPGRAVAVTPLLDRTDLTAVQNCRGDSRLDSELAAGSYQVRAVDWAGNEDGNAVFRRLDSNCAGWGCAVAAALDDGAPWGGWAAGGLAAVLAYHHRRRVKSR